MFEYDSREDSDLISKHISRERINSPLIRQVIEEEIANAELLLCFWHHPWLPIKDR
jgi:hypothetical protein